MNIVKTQDINKSALEVFKLIFSVVLVIFSLVGFYLLSKQGSFIQWSILTIGFLLSAGIFLFSTTGKTFTIFCQDAYRELGKVVWPKRKEAIQMTIYVFIFAVVMALFLWLTDKVLEWFMYDFILGWRD